MWLFLALAAALLQGGTSPAIPTGTIEGTVQHLNSNAAVAGISIKATISSGSVAQTATDAVGHFVLRDVSPGQLRLETGADGYMFTLRLSSTSTAVESHNLLNLNGNLFLASRQRVFDAQRSG
jgi:hypothetical protein